MPSDRPDGALPIDLSTALRLAGAKAVLVDLARSKAMSVASTEEIVLSRWFPVVGPRVGYTRTEGLVQGTEGDFVDVGKQNLFLGVGAEWKVNPAGNWYAALAARKRTEAAAHSIDVAGHGVLLQAANGYYDLVEAHASLEIARRTLRAARELKVLAETREGLGVGLPSDVLRAGARERQAEGLIAEALGESRVASARLVELLVLDPGTHVVPGKVSTGKIAFLDPSTDLVTLYERALARRPDLMVARAHTEAADESRKGADRSWYWPTFTARGAGGGFGQNFGRLDDQETFYVGVQWELGPSIPAVQRRAEADRRVASLALTLASRRALREIQESVARIRASDASHAAATQEVLAAREALKLARDQLEAGEGLLLAVLDLEAALVRAETAQVRAVLAANRAHYALLHGVGGPE